MNYELQVIPHNPHIEGKSNGLPAKKHKETIPLNFVRLQQDVSELTRDKVLSALRNCSFWQSIQGRNIEEITLTPDQYLELLRQCNTLLETMKIRFVDSEEKVTVFFKDHTLVFQRKSQQ